MASGQTIGLVVAAAIVAIAAGYLLRRLIRMLRGRGECNCGRPTDECPLRDEPGQRPPDCPS